MKVKISTGALSNPIPIGEFQFFFENLYPQHKLYHQYDYGFCSSEDWKYCAVCEKWYADRERPTFVVGKCISQNVFLKMYFQKCISKNVFLKMYF